MRDLAMNIDELALDAVWVEGWILAIRFQEVECGGGHIVGAGGILPAFPAVFVAGTVTRAAFESAAGHPSCGRLGVVVAPFRFPCINGWRPNSVVPMTHV